MQVEVEIDLAGHPVVVAFGKESQDKAQTGIRGGDDACHPEALAQLPVDPLQANGGAQPDAMRWREVEHGQALGDGFFGPFGQLRMVLAPRRPSRPNMRRAAPALSRPFSSWAA